MNCGKLHYYRGRWPEEDIPKDAPVWLLYEVDPVEDVVLRAVEVFADGHSERNSLELEARDGFPCLSVVEGAFMPTVAEAKLEKVTANHFEKLWQRSIDKPTP
jgi:hypothetical protein